MKIIKYNKLIRDKIPQIIKRNKAIPKLSHLSDKQFVTALKKKLIEESVELQKAKGKHEILNELSDISEIIQTVARVEKIKWSEVEKKRIAKNKERGGFKKKLFLREVKGLD